MPPPKESSSSAPRRFWIETLGCPKNEVDSDKLMGTLLADGYEPASEAAAADLVVVNTCAFIEAAREESVNTVLALSEGRKHGAEVVVTGCLAERHGAELALALPEVSVRGFNVAVTLSPRHRKPVSSVPAFDLLNLPRPRSARPWAYVKIAEGCDRACGFCAIPSFRGKQRSRPIDAILDEVGTLDAREVVLVAQDLASFGRDQGRGEKALVPLVHELRRRVEWVRLLYLYPSELTDDLVDAICATGVPYFDLSLQHVSAPLLRRMRRWGDGNRFARRIAEIRRREPRAVFRSNFIVGYPGETERDHDELLSFLDECELDWCGFFAYSPEDGTHAVTLDGAVEPALVRDRLSELSERQDALTATARDRLIGSVARVLVDQPGQARSFREAPEIDGVIAVPEHLAAGTFHDVQIVDALGPDLEARVVSPSPTFEVEGALA